MRLWSDKARGPGAKRPLYLGLTLVYMAMAILLFCANPQFIQSLRYLVFDSYQRIWPAQQQSGARVRVVDIDEESLKRIGQWPWPRSTMARLTDALGQGGARAIAFDVMFPEPDRTSPEQILQSQPPERARLLQTVIASWQPNDAVFAQVLGANPAVLAVTLTNQGPALSFPQKVGLVAMGDLPQHFVPGYRTVSQNLPALTAAASGIGAINWIPDRDQVVRRVPLFFRQGENLAPSLALEALRVAEGESTYMIRSSNASGQSALGAHTGVNVVRVGAYTIPTDPDSALWIRFRRADPSAYIPAWRVLGGEFGASEVRGAIVLIGASAAGLMDLRATPLDASIPGVEVHQQVLEHILGGRFLSRPDYAPALELIIAVVGIVIFAVWCPKLPASVTAGLGAGLIAAIFAVGCLAYLWAGILIDPLYPALSIFVFEVVSTFYLYRRTEQQRSDIRRAFGQYVSPAVIHQLMANPERLALGGEERQLSLLFCDVRNFTSISERMNATELTAFINSLLTPLTDIILERGGTIDKYMGDAIMAFWNAPLDDPDHARHACGAAIAIAEKLSELNAEWAAQAAREGKQYVDVEIGIGINTGDCCVGNLGSLRRFDYSAIGDNVNITSRFEGLTKIYGLPLIVGEDTMRLVEGVDFVEVDLVRVKGRKAPSRIFTVVSLLGLDASAYAAYGEAHTAFLISYREGHWDEAQARLEQVRALCGQTLGELYGQYERRLAQLRNNTASSWDGVYNLEAKG